MTSFEKHLSEPIQNILPFLWWVCRVFCFCFFFTTTALLSLSMSHNINAKPEKNLVSLILQCKQNFFVTLWRFRVSELDFSGLDLFRSIWYIFLSLKILINLKDVFSEICYSRESRYRIVVVIVLFHRCRIQVNNLDLFPTGSAIVHCVSWYFFLLLFRSTNTTSLKFWKPRLLTKIMLNFRLSIFISVCPCRIRMNCPFMVDTQHLQYE